MTTLSNGTHDRKEPKHLNQHPQNDIFYRFCYRHFSIFLEPSEEVLDAVEDMYERVMVRNNVLRRLWRFNIINAGKGRFMTIITESGTPAPEKMTTASKNTWIYDMRC